MCCAFTTTLASGSRLDDQGGMRIFIRILILAILPLSPSMASETINAALSDAMAAFGRAAPHLPSVSHGVDVAAYSDALLHGQFNSRYWGQPLEVELRQPSAGTGSCQRFAAYVRLPPEDGKVELVFCPQFVNEGTPALRRLTILHEMVHVVAGPDECRAMAFAAHIENLATGGFTPVDPYWRANNCADSGFNLP